MRAKYFALAFFTALPLGAQAEEPFPTPEGCSSYAGNKTGGDANCDAAIAKETNPEAKSVMLFRRAYMEDAAGDFKTYPTALTDLDEAIKLWPQNVQALHERGYLYNEYGRWKDAEANLDAQIRLTPNGSQGYQERALARFNLGDLQGTFDDRNTAAILDPENPSNYMARADAAIWTGNFALAQKDIAKAVELSPADKKKDISPLADKKRALIAFWTQTSTSGAAGCMNAEKAGDMTRANLIGDCTLAFFAATTPAAKADALTVRSMAWLVAKSDEENAASDNIVAAAIDPSPGNLSNLGYAYMRVHHSAAAIEEFNRSIVLQPNFANYAGRANAKLNLSDYKGAAEDAQKSNDMKPNEAALTILGDCAYATKKSFDEAKPYWIAAYHLGDRDDGLIARLKEAGVPIPPPDDTKPVLSK